jgi:uncharacterized membrane protein YfcA
MNWWMLVFGVVVGFVSGIIGIGGGVVIVPALVLMTGMTQHRAQGTSLAVLLAPAGALAVYEYWKEGNVDIRIAALLAIGFIVGGYFGGRWAQFIPDLMLKRIFAVSLIAIGAKMLIFK